MTSTTKFDRLNSDCTCSGTVCTCYMSESIEQIVERRLRYDPPPTSYKQPVGKVLEGEILPPIIEDYGPVNWGFDGVKVIGPPPAMNRHERRRAWALERKKRPWQR